METPKTEAIVATVKKAGALMGGLVVAHAVKQGLMTTALTPDKTEPLVPDNTMINGGAFVAALAGSLFVKQPEIQVGLLAIAAYFGIRSLNKVTDGMSGLGAEGDENSIKAVMQKWLPNLRGFGNTDAPGSASENDALYTRLLNLPAQNYAVGNNDITPINGADNDRISTIY